MSLLEEVKMKLEALDLQGKVLLLQTRARTDEKTLQGLRAMVKPSGCIGVLYLPLDTVEVNTLTLDKCIEHLQKLKEENEAKRVISS